MKNNIWRKCFAAVLSLMLLLSVALPTNATVLLGDVNGDGKLTVFDAQMLLESAFQLRNLTPEQLAAAGNATVSQLLESILGKKEEQTPVKEFVVPEGGYDGSPVTVTFYYNLGGDLPLILEKYCAQFQELYPSITVELINLRNFSGNHEQVLQDIAAGTTPNLVYNQAVHGIVRSG